MGPRRAGQGPTAASWWGFARSSWLAPGGLLGDGIARLDQANMAAVAAAVDARVKGPLPHRAVAHRQPKAAPDVPANPAWAGT
jgi:hypothetical protein